MVTKLDMTNKDPAEVDTTVTFDLGQCVQSVLGVATESR